MIGSILFWVYVVPLALCLVSAAWHEWFSGDPKARLGSITALIVAFVPVINIWWILASIGFMIGFEPKKDSRLGKVEEWMWTATLASCAVAVIGFEKATSLWQSLKRRSID